jgi:hypothetical protein
MDNTIIQCISATRTCMTHMVLSGAVLIGFGPKGLAGISLIRLMVDAERDKKQYNVRCGCANWLDNTGGWIWKE